jgi:hypothetical protein
MIQYLVKDDVKFLKSKKASSSVAPTAKSKIHTPPFIFATATQHFLTRHQHRLTAVDNKSLRLALSIIRCLEVKWVAATLPPRHPYLHTHLQA